MSSSDLLTVIVPFLANMSIPHSVFFFDHKKPVFNTKKEDLPCFWRQQHSKIMTTWNWKGITLLVVNFPPTIRLIFFTKELSPQSRIGFIPSIVKVLTLLWQIVSLVRDIAHKRKSQIWQSDIIIHWRKIMDRTFKINFLQKDVRRGIGVCFWILIGHLCLVMKIFVIFYFSQYM